MPKRDDFWLDGDNAFQHGIRLQREIFFSAPEPNVESFKIPGRNGEIVLSDGSFGNIEATAKCYCLDEDVASAITAVNAWLMCYSGYRRFETMMEPRIFRKARLKNGAKMEPRLGKINPFVLTFDCMPQKYYKIGEKPIDISEEITLENLSPFIALPLIVLHGNGSGSVTVNDRTMTFTDCNEVTVDCEEQEVYRNSSNLNSTASGSFFQLEKSNNITISGDITSITLTPRWWTL